MISKVALTCLLSALVTLARPTPPTEVEAQLTQVGNVCTVLPQGGAKDDGPALLLAFEQCANNSIIELPGPLYTVQTVLDTVLHNTVINLDGIIQYTPNISYWSPASIFLTYQNATTAWKFSGANVTLQSPLRTGGIDGSGQTWWDAYATIQSQGGSGVAGGSSRIFARPVPLAIVDAFDIKIDGLSITNSPFWHMFTYQVEKVEFSNLFLNSVSTNASAPASNTDGLDTYRSTNVVFRDSVINNDDDCVSFKPNSTQIHVENLHCTGSHGISVGSLGQYYGETDFVTDVYAKNIACINCQNGARIKAFPGSNNTQSVDGGGNGYVRNITWENYYVQNTDNPIIVTGCYNYDANSPICQEFPSQVEISDINFINITGYASGKTSNSTVGSIRCSSECEDITAKGVNIGLYSNYTSGQYVCTNVATLDQLNFPCVQVPFE